MEQRGVAPNGRRSERKGNESLTGTKVNEGPVPVKRRKVSAMGKDQDYVVKSRVREVRHWRKD